MAIFIPVTQPILVWYRWVLDAKEWVNFNTHLNFQIFSINFFWSILDTISNNSGIFKILSICYVSKSRNFSCKQAISNSENSVFITDFQFMEWKINPDAPKLEYFIRISCFRHKMKTWRPGRNIWSKAFSVGESTFSVSIYPNGDGKKTKAIDAFSDWTINDRLIHKNTD